MADAAHGSPDAARGGALIIVSGPSGCGKTTVVRRLLERNPEYRRSISVTTRAKRPGEENGKDYYFRSREEFERLRQAGELLEWSEHFGHRYGTPRRPVEQALADGAVIILELDVNGAGQTQERVPGARGIFVNAPSREELIARLRARKTESEERIQERLARMDFELARRRLFDVEVINTNVERAVVEMEKFIVSEVRKDHAGYRAS